MKSIILPIIVSPRAIGLISTDENHTLNKLAVSNGLSELLPNW